MYAKTQRFKGFQNVTTDFGPGHGSPDGEEQPTKRLRD